MNFDIIYFIIFVSALIFLRTYKPSLLFLIWPVTCFIFKTTRTVFYTAPIYWNDFSFLFLISVFPLKSYINRWLALLPPWHLYLILVSFVFGCISAVIFFGPAPEIFYVFFHKSICWLAFPLGVFVFHPQSKKSYQNNLIWGLVIVACSYAAWGMAESGSPARSLFLNNIFFRDISSESYAAREGASKLYAGRPNGPFMTGTSFGGACTIIAYICWYLSTVFKTHRKKLLLGAFVALIAMLFTVSRLDIIAVTLSFFTFIIFSHAKSKVTALGLGVFALTMIIIFSNTFVVSTIFSRFERWGGGVSTDESFTARSQAGPKRLVTFISGHPYILLTGAGMEVDKLAQRSVKVEGFDAGFLSNGFLLFLYYTGFIGFMVYTSFWLWMIYKSVIALNFLKAQSIAIIIGLIFIIFSDNYSALDESIIKGLFLAAGLIIGSNYFERMRIYNQGIENDTSMAYTPLKSSY